MLDKQPEAVKVAVHGLIGGAITALVGGDFAKGAAGTAAGTAVIATLNDNLGSLGLDEPTRNAVLQTVGMAVAGAVAGGSANGAAAAGAAGMADAYNRQLHPDERKWAQRSAQDFAQFYKDQTGKDLTLEQAQNMLLANGYRMVDAVASKGPGGDSVAAAYISQNAGNLFTATTAQYNNPFLNGNKDGSLTPEQTALPGARPTIEADYVSANRSGAGLAGNATLNLHNGQPYLGGGGTVPISPSGSVVWGFIFNKQGDPAAATDSFLDGASYVAGGCWGLCFNINKAIGGSYALEIGFGSPGVAAGTGVSKPIGKK